jgi:LPPG:FO 2-phospho-L-lactate transferase
LGFAVSPDLDTVMYTLAGVNNPASGWGRAHETWSFMSALGALGGEAWFRLGDRDLAVHVLRTLALERGATLSEITHALAKRFGIRHNILPMSDSPVRTRVLTSRGELAFQDYFVRRACAPRVTGFRYRGSRKAGIAPALQKIMRTRKVRAVVICPSNPYVSVAPILSVPEMRVWIKQRDFPVVAVSPIVGGAALKGPAAKMMRELGCEATALGVVRHYGGCVDAWVIDRRDAKLQHAIEREGKTVIVADTVMSNRRKSAQLAQRVVALAKALASERS